MLLGPKVHQLHLASREGEPEKRQFFGSPARQVIVAFVYDKAFVSRVRTADCAVRLNEQLRLTRSAVQYYASRIYITSVSCVNC